jgi:hypothetical protein
LVFPLANVAPHHSQNSPDPQGNRQALTTRMKIKARPVPNDQKRPKIFNNPILNIATILESNVGPFQPFRPPG